MAETRMTDALKKLKSNVIYKSLRLRDQKKHLIYNIYNKETWRKTTAKLKYRKTLKLIQIFAFEEIKIKMPYIKMPDSMQG